MTTVRQAFTSDEPAIEAAMATGLSRAEAEENVKTQRAGAPQRSTLSNLTRGVPIVGKPIDDLLNPGFQAQQQAHEIQSRAAAEADRGTIPIPGAPETGSPPTQVVAAGVRRPSVSVFAPQLQADGTVDMGPEGYQIGPERVTPSYDVTRPAMPSQYGENVFRPEELRTLMSGAQADPASIAAQRRALSELTGIVDQGGLTAIDRARIADTRADADQYLRGQREATLANMEARGMRGSGAELMAQLQAQQAAGQRMSDENLQTEAMAQRRAMEALGMLGGQAGQVRGQSYGEASNLAQAGDAMNRYNQQALDTWQRNQQNEAWRRYGASRDEAASRYNRAMGFADRAEQRGREAQARTDNLVNAGISYAVGGDGQQPQQQGQQQPTYNPGVTGYEDRRR